MRNSTKLVMVAVLGLMLGAAGQARAGIILDTRDSTVDDSTGLQSGSGLGSTIVVGASDVAITNIEVNARIWQAGTIVDFLIFDHQVGNLLYSQAKSFSEDLGLFTYKKSDDFSFVLSAGKTYDIGATYTWTSGNSAGIGIDFRTNSQNGLTSTTPSSEFNGHTDFRNRWSWDPQIRLDGADTLATPEPSTIVSASIACLMGLGYGWRRRKAKPTA